MRAQSHNKVINQAISETGLGVPISRLQTSLKHRRERRKPLERDLHREPEEVRQGRGGHDRFERRLVALEALGHGVGLDFPKLAGDRCTTLVSKNSQNSQKIPQKVHKFCGIEREDLEEIGRHLV